ncbi:MAG: hypothetical protein ABR516_04880, partial [Desulfuromonadaceae bacterium]
DGEFDTKIARIDASSSGAADMGENREIEVPESAAAAAEAMPEVSRHPATDSDPERKTWRLERKVKDYLDAGR